MLASPRGFCAGVERAIEIVERALELHGAPIYVRHEIVHNKYVVEDLRAKGAVFVEELDEVPDRRHRDLQRARRVAGRCAPRPSARGLKVFDATCPLVTKVHVEVTQDAARTGYEIVMIGHRGHPEVEGTWARPQQRHALVETVEDVAHAAVARPGKPRLRHADHALGGRRRRDRRRAQGALSARSSGRRRTTSATRRRTARTR